MTRQPNPKSKTATVILKANNEDEAKRIRGLKEICVRNGLEIRKVILNGIDKFLKEHNWPPGNSQTLLQVFGEKPRLICFKCREEFYTLNHVEFISGKTARVCDTCLVDYEERTLIKKRVKRNY